MNNKPVYFITSGYVTMIKRENVIYDACPTCNKKLIRMFVLVPTATCLSVCEMSITVDQERSSVVDEIPHAPHVIGYDPRLHVRLLPISFCPTACRKRHKVLLRALQQPRD